MEFEISMKKVIMSCNMQYTRRVKRIYQLIPASSLMFLGFLVSTVPISQGQQVIKQVASVGENLTLNCYPPRNEYAQLQWKRKRGENMPEYLVNINTNPLVEDTVYSGNSSFSYYYNESWNDIHTSLALYLTSANIGDSGNYTCQFLPRDITRGLIHYTNYDVKVIGCTCSKSDGSRLISCDLSGYEHEKMRYIQVELNERLNVNGLITESKLVFTLPRKGTVENVRFQPYNNATSEVSCSFDLRLDETLIVSSTLTSSRKMDLPVLIWKSTTASRYHSTDDLSSNRMTHPSNIHFSTLSSQEVSHAGKHITVVTVVVVVVLLVFVFIAFGLFKCCKDKKSRRDHARIGTKNEIERHGQSPLSENLQSEPPAYENVGILYSVSEFGNDRMSATIGNACISPLASPGTSDTGSTCKVNEDECLTPIPLKGDIVVISKDEDDYTIPTFRKHDERDPSSIKNSEEYSILLPTCPTVYANANMEEVEHLYNTVLY